MHILLIDTAGQIREGVVLAAGQNTMRVALKGQNDTMELRRSYGMWTSDEDQRFEIAAITADTDSAISRLGKVLQTQTMTAGTQSLT